MGKWQGADCSNAILLASDKQIFSSNFCNHTSGVVRNKVNWHSLVCKNHIYRTSLVLRMLAEIAEER